MLKALSQNRPKATWVNEMGLVAMLGVTDEGVTRAGKYMDAYTSRYDDNVHVMNDLKGAIRNFQEIKYDGLLIVEDLPILKEDGKLVHLLDDKSYVGTCDFLLRSTRILNRTTPAVVLTGNQDTAAYQELLHKGVTEAYDKASDVDVVVDSLYRFIYG